MFSTLLTYGKDAKNSQLRAQGYVKDDWDQIDLIDLNKGTQMKKDLFQKSSIVEFQGPFMSMQKRYLNNTRLNIKLNRTSNEFALINH